MKRLLLLATSTLFALLLAELGLRALGLYRPPPLPEPVRPDLYVEDARIGYRLWPSTRTCIRYPSDARRVLELVSNRDGFRSSRELGEPDPRPRVLVVGDSFVQGSGVEEGERLTEWIETLEPGLRVEPLAMSGWGVGLMLRALETYGPKAAPDVVILAVYTDDFRRAQQHYAGNGYQLPRYRLEDGRLVDAPFRVFRGWQRSRLFQAAWTRRARATRNQWTLNAALFDRFFELSGELGAQPATAFLPGRSLSREDEERRDFLAAWSGEHRVPFVDLSGPLREAGVDETYIEGNPHWTVRGHQIAGEVLRTLLVEEMGVEPLGGFDGSAVPRTAPDPAHCYDAVYGD